MASTQSFTLPANRVPSHSMVQRAEATFDTAILSDNLVQARNIATICMDILSNDTARGIYTPGLSRIALKEVALPLYGRAMYDAVYAPYTEAKIGASGVYKDAVLLLEYFKTWADGLAQWGVDSDDYVLTDLQGSESELTIFALTARKISGSPEDALTILPSTDLQDTDPQFDQNGKKNNFDFVVRQRADQKVIPLQVKTGFMDVRDYSPNIAVVSTVGLAGGRRENEQLKLALIADINGNANQRQIKLIEKASAKLDELYAQHFHRFGRQALTAANL